MKRRGNLYEDMCSFESLLEAARRARRGKRYVSGCHEFFLNLEGELWRLHRELTSFTYRPGPYRTFVIREGKNRIISAAPFRDRVVHHALVAALEPIFEPAFIHDTYANRVGKCTHKAVDRFTEFSRQRPYVLKCDVRKFFPSVDHRILLGLVARKVKDPSILWLVDSIVRGWSSREGGPSYFPGDDLFTPGTRRRGLPIGNLTSQFWANVYLDPLDHFVKETLRCRRYIRYMDDFVLLHQDKSVLRQWRDRIIAFLAGLRLRLHLARAQVSPVGCGADFLGYLVFPDHRRVRSGNVARFRRRLRRMREDYRELRLGWEEVTARVRSWIAHAAHADSYRLREKIFAATTFCREGQAI